MCYVWISPPHTLPYTVDQLGVPISAASGALITQSSTALYWPWGVAVDGSGNIYVANYGYGDVLKLLSVQVVGLLSPLCFRSGLVFSLVIVHRSTLSASIT